MLSVCLPQPHFLPLSRDYRRTQFWNTVLCQSPLNMFTLGALNEGKPPFVPMPIAARVSGYGAVLTRGRRCSKPCPPSTTRVLHIFTIDFTVTFHPQPTRVGELRNIPSPLGWGNYVTVLRDSPTLVGWGRGRAVT
jgi:hypothetical protein